ncbi:hypothetical protein GCK72_006094 [Caenorhabditis remanei]|uniref:Uncharacterized protein n=1 Tax=Caenorhabditis remanei TaxID=31234 RepID=A0A2P4V7U5_CAERE|nr:hypothetical protein GCK72_006094 [Caenorhabditis remanei]KAF1766138.1 hypothetical protein GCK72_006094 [Caenorhabditis remanei]
MLSAAPPKHRFGFRVFVASCIFTTVTIFAVMWDERRQKERRQEGVKYRLNAIQQHANMEEYELQKKRYEEYKNANS